MNWRLLSQSEIERLLLGKAQSWEPSSDLPICTVIDPLLAIEKAKKSPEKYDASEFCKQWQELSNQITVLDLDADCLNRALFDRSDMDAPQSLWPEAIAIPQPHRRVRRLVLRANYADPTLYNQMESLYSEEQNR